MRKCRFCHEDIADAATVCPHCRRDLIPGRHTAPALTTSAPPPSVKKCPFCAEEIQAAAIKCRHCGSMLGQSATTPAQIATKSTATSAVASSGSNRKLSGLQIAVFLPLGLLAVGLLLYVFAQVDSPPAPAPSSTNTTPVPSKPASVTLQATAAFTGTQIIIANTGLDDWRDVKMEINGGIFSSGYVNRTDSIAAKNTYTVGAMQFTTSDGTRFNPFQVKPQQITISATLPDDSFGIVTFGWK